jgi:ubiquinone/menaquinone biosynthesis C-methylase UbiE
VKPKPKYLGSEYSAGFKYRSVAQAYQYRAPYPPEIFGIISALITAEPRAVLDVGCGTGAIARNLIGFADRIDAVDFSKYMIEEGKKLPNGNHPKLRWIIGSVEDVPLNPPYALITAGESLHWMEWEVVFLRFKKVLTPNAYLALISRVFSPFPWDDDLKKIISRFSTNPDYKPYDLCEELQSRGLFQKQGSKETAPVLYRQSLDAYIEHFHSTSSLTRRRMGRKAADAFDQEVQDLVSRFTKDEILESQIRGKVVWGLPLSP